MEISTYIFWGIALLLVFAPITASPELDTLLASNTSVIVDFYADWCPPCRAIAPVFSQLADEYAVTGHVAFAKVNVDNVKDVAAKYGVSAMPTFVVFRNGKPGGVAVDGLQGRTSVNTGADGAVERVLGADRVALEAIVKAVASK
ncbi:unnamed protein product [Parascedosporium putredinis]|uniref:Thioredoxin domain-containing protein n=1 Tax=Parascedosporium putredinis TaxID=1442378 RepID=A0A9P1MCE5_9PEZI|nr:unnamed protein product [Parascedosporium putredinis]CAI8000582.1 unnamed protein product [Parascedosporium putredinis]